MFVSSPASKIPETPAKASYRLVGDLHGMQEVSGSSPLGSIRIDASYTAYLKNLFFLENRINIKKYA